MKTPFPRDVSFIQNGRRLEVEAVLGGRRSNELSMTQSSNEVLPTEEDAQETDERLQLLTSYVPFMNMAFDERGLAYPFARSHGGDALSVSPRSIALATRCAELSEMVGKGNGALPIAKNFEKRAVGALHSLIGGWAVCVGHPRDDGTGLAKAVRAFRSLIRNDGNPFDGKKEYSPGGDLGADAFWVLGRSWSGPIIYFQAKNTQFSIDDVPGEFFRVSDVLLEWFGRRLDQGRSLIRVFGVNSVLT